MERHGILLPQIPEKNIKKRNSYNVVFSSTKDKVEHRGFFDHEVAYKNNPKTELKSFAARQEAKAALLNSRILKKRASILLNQEYTDQVLTRKT